MSFAALLGRPMPAKVRSALTNQIDGPHSQFEQDTVLLTSSEPGDWGDAVHNLKEDAADIRLVGRARIYNFAELALMLSESVEISTAQLLIAAYKKWDADLAGYLVGDFAFVVWNASTSRLLAFRDHFGVRPLYYRRIEGSLLFSDSERLLGVEATSPVSRTFVSALLAGAVNSGSATAHPGIRRVLPGYTLVVDKSGETISPYWTLQPLQHDTSKPEQGFRRRFEVAVTSRLPKQAEVACMLSGGLDSSAIAGVLRKHLPKSVRLKSYSMVYADKANRHLDERRYIDKVTKQDGYDTNYIYVDNYQPLSTIKEMLTQQLGPYLAPGLAKTQSIYKRLSEDRIRFIFDGHGGDEIVWYGSSRIMELAARGSWFSAFALLPTHAKLFGDSPLALGALLLIHYAPPNSLGRLMRRLARAAVKRGMISVPQSKWQTYLSEAVLASAGSASQASRLPPEQRADDQANHLAAATSPLMGYAFEVLDKASSSFGVEVIYPFFDTALAEYCLALPSSEKLRHDGTRSILRRALRGVVPKQILRRRDKTDFRAELVAGLSTHHRSILLAMKEDANQLLAPYVNSLTLPKLITRAIDAPNSLAGDEVLLLWRIACLYCWLDMGGRVVDEGLEPME